MTKEERIEQIRAEMAQDPDYYERVRQEIQREGHARLDEIQANLRKDPKHYESLEDSDLEKLAAVQAALDKYLRSDNGRQLMDSVRKYNLLTAEAMEKYDLTPEQLDEILGANIEQLHAMEFSDFVAGSITEDDHLAVNGLLDAIVKRAREEGRPVSEIIKETAEAVEGTASPLYPVPYNKALNALSFLNKRNTAKQGGALTSENNDYRIVIRGPGNKDLSQIISADKLLKTALIKFAKVNHLSRKNPEVRYTRIEIPLKEYTALLGNDITPKETSTPEEAAEEKKRIKIILDNTRKKIKDAGQTLYDISVEWYEKDGTPSNLRRILTGVDFPRGKIALHFNSEIAEALASSTAITQYNINMVSITERRPNAYRIMQKMTEHYNMISNQSKGTHDRLSVKTLLEVTALPSFEEVQTKSRGHWADRIKEPLEENLDYLTQNNFLADWKYTKAKGEPLTDEEAQQITRYEDFINLYIVFEPCDTIDHTERIEKKRAETEKRKAAEKKKAVKQ